MKYLTAAALGIILVSGVSGHFLHSRTAAPPHETSKKSARLQVQPELVLEQSLACPAACVCKPGDTSNGGVAAEAMCYHFCSAPHHNATSNEWVRYCGEGGTYTEGDFVDCRACKDPKYYYASYTLHQPAGQATESIILLGPWNASKGWGMEWVMNYSESVDPRIRQHSRILDAVGRPSGQNQRNERFDAWYGYENYEQWFKGVPLPHEVDHAVAWVHHLIEQEKNIVGDYKRVVLIGLHQGANLALESSLRFPHPLGLVMSERGVLIPSRTESSASVAQTPYILTATGNDIVYTESQIKSNCDFLKSIHASAFMKTFPGFDHFMWSQEESILALKSLSAALSEAPVSTQTLSALTEWTNAP